jgi:dipeptidyl aminopeptidase/acylaminoacyl peptidase
MSITIKASEKLQEVRMKLVLLAVLLSLSFGRHALAAPPLEAYGRLPEIETMGLSPSGKRYAFIASNGDTRRLGVVEDGKVILINEFGNIKLRGFEWVGEDRLLVEQTATLNRPLDLTQAHELSTYINIDLRAKKAAPMISTGKKVANVVIDDAGTVNIEGQAYKYFTGLALAWSKAQLQQGNGYFFEGDHRNLYRINLESGDVTLRARGGEGPGFDWVVGNDGEVLAHSVYDNTTGKWRLYAGEGSKTLLLERTVKDGRGRIHLHALGRKPNTVWISDSTNGWPVYEEISIPDGKSEILLPGVNVAYFQYDPDSRLGIGAALLDEPGGIFFDEKLQARFKGTRKAFPDHQMQLVSFSRNLEHLLVLTDGGDDSGTYWLVNITTGSATPVGRKYPDVGPKDVGPVRRIEYRAADGSGIHAVLTLPPGRKAEKLPLVMLPLDNPVGGHVDVGFNWVAQAFASAGYAVLQPEHRGSSTSREFMAAGYGQLGAAMQTDLSDGIAALAAQGIVDPGRVCIVGNSYGGYAALAGATLQHDIYRCVVSIGGPGDLPEFYRTLAERYGSQSDATRFWTSLAGAEQDRSRVLRERSPAGLAAQASAPVLLIHGKDDTVVPFAQSEKMAAALRAADKPVELVELAGEDHWLSLGETRKAMLKAAVEFVKKNNPPG